MDLPPFHFDESPSDHFPLDFSTHEVMESDEHTTDGWTLAENKTFEQCLVEFEISGGTSKTDFFEYVEKKSLTWKTKESIKLHYEAFLDDLKMIESSSRDYQNEKRKMVTNPLDHQPVDHQPTQNCSRAKKKATPWTEEEHKTFLAGLQAFGKGDWKNIAKYYVTTRTAAQVASHAQKFYTRINTSTPVHLQRRSINDIQEINGYNFKTEVQNPQTNAPTNYQVNNYY